MKYFRSAYKSLCVAFMLCALLPRVALANPAANKEAMHFALCSSNVKSIILTKVPGNGTKWEFVITLNSVGAQQFRRLEEKNPRQLVDVVWVGVSFGRRRLDLPVQSDAKKLVLGSKWFSFRAAEEHFDLLNNRLLRKRNLNFPCGAQATAAPGAGPSR